MVDYPGGHTFLHQLLNLPQLPREIFEAREELLEVLRRLKDHPADKPLEVGVDSLHVAQRQHEAGRSRLK